ncbi:sodium- and chloride-dependent glycine transporter 1-like [Diadema antillarum]|uniref:sodium- and chloride-dependent glycine transporter 1-like n=1 Tax=Diadema antillarum TaxID=105358 RepID=UPI003A899073
MDVDFHANLDVDVNGVKSDVEIEDVLTGGGSDKYVSNGMDMDLEAAFDAQLNDLNRTPEALSGDDAWPSPNGEEHSPIENGADVVHDDQMPTDAMGGDGYLDADMDIATEGSLDLEVDPVRDIAAGSLDFDTDIPVNDHPADQYPPDVDDTPRDEESPEQPIMDIEQDPMLSLEHAATLEPTPDTSPEPTPEPMPESTPEPAPVRQSTPTREEEELQPLCHESDKMEEPAQGELPEQGGEVAEEAQPLMSDEGIADFNVEAGALTEGSLDLDVGDHVIDDDDDADVFESNEKLDSSPSAYVNTTLVSNASSLGGHEPAPAHAQSLIARSNDDVNGDVTVTVGGGEAGGDAGREPAGDEDITVIEPTTETKLLEPKENGDTVVEKALTRKGFPPPFPIGYMDENLHKGNWGHKMEFMCAIFCVVFNIDNFVRFSYRMCENGGVVFLIPYMIALFLLILPLVLVEISLGQFSSSSFLTCWKFCPLLKGLSLGMLLQLFGFTFLSGPISGHSLYYIYSVFLPSPVHHIAYMTCDNAWNTPACHLLMPLQDVNGTSANDSTSLYDMTEPNTVYDLVSGNMNNTPQEEFYRFHVKMQADGTNDLGAPVTHLMISLAIAWVIAFHIMLFGVKSFGKVAYILVGFHVLFLLVFLIRGALLDGAMDGIKLLFWPHVEKLCEVQVWSTAFSCAVSTFAPMCGILMSLGSYNKFHNNCFMDSVVLILVALFVNLLSAVTFFTYVGYGNAVAGTEYLHETYSETGDTIFVLLAMIFGTLPHARIMSFLLFFFSFLASLSFQVVAALSIVIGFIDVIGCRHSWKALVPTSFLITAVCFGGGLLFVTPEGPHFADVLRKYFLPHIPYIISVIMCLAVTWIYGTLPTWKFLRFQRDIKAMVGCFPVVFQGLFAGLEAVIVPPVLATAWVFSLYLLFKGLQVSEEPYQGWHIAVAIVFAFVPLIIGFLCGAVMELCKYIKSYMYFTELFWRASIPHREWGPAVEEIRTEHGYPPLDEPRDDMIQEEKYRDLSCENINNANNSRQDVAYSMSLHDEVSHPPSTPREKREIAYPDGNDLEQDLNPAVSSNATLPAGTPLLGLSLCSHETTL